MISDAKRRLQHDVGKYVSRIARNLDGRTVTRALIDLLLRDLYEAPGGGRPAQRFAALSACLAPEARAPITARFVELDALEAALRRGDETAARHAAGIALDIARAIDDAPESG
jgi:hypothetical protein